MAESKSAAIQSAGFDRLEDLLDRAEWFRDSGRPPRKSRAAPILVIDDFYADPVAVREIALGMEYARYVPPDPAIVGKEIGARHAARRGDWHSTALVGYHGEVAEFPFYGARHNPPEVRDRLQGIVGEEIVEETWDSSGDYWNGAFHLRSASLDMSEGKIHHHHKPGDIATRGWSGAVYLSPDAPPECGTSFWRHRASGLCVARFDEAYSSDQSEFELVLAPQNRFNRLVLFHENVWHSAREGFRSGKDARLTQTFFFETRD